MTKNKKERSYLVTGGKPLRGTVKVAGAKNAATKELVAALLTDEKVVLSNAPDIGDVAVTAEMLEDLGVKISRKADQVTLDASKLKNSRVSEAFSGKNRIPILFLGPLLHRFGKAVIPSLGGCSIGGRTVDFHVEALQKMGATISCEGNTYMARTTGLKGAVIELPFPSVGATENVILSAVLAKGTTIIKNAAIEPEIKDLAMLLQSMGAIINLEANRTWIIEGVERLGGAHHRIIPDRIEAASFAVAAALTGGDVLIEEARQGSLLSFLNAMRKVGVEYEITEKGVRFMGAKKLRPIVIETDVHPGFMTDWQQPFVMLLTQATGVSIVHETVYENRFGYTDALKQMGANIQLHSECLGSKPCRYQHRDYRHSAVIVGPTPLRAADIRIPDLRAGFSYLIAALVAEGKSRITGVEIIERGYEDIIGKLKKLGAKIEVE
ncbi:MAG: UDP-N-acetylglucosamine 1-carboxyvinyltransferase [Patescibacteria group bacterium]|nr:UDP-N-acetylglucosamine 1-carboxyvinyltransferase [Patescibacteria group bacterium]